MLVSWSAGSPLPEAGLNWLSTHNGVGVFFGPKAMPHGFLTFGSVRVAIPGMSETRLTWRNMRVSLPPFAVDAALAPEEVVAAVAASRPRVRTRAAPPRWRRRRPLRAVLRMWSLRLRTAPVLPCLIDCPFTACRRRQAFKNGPPAVTFLPRDPLRQG